VLMLMMMKYTSNEIDRYALDTLAVAGDRYEY
jgi:hypothetical protein